MIIEQLLYKTSSRGYYILKHTYIYCTKSNMDPLRLDIINIARKFIT